MNPDLPSPSLLFVDDDETFLHVMSYSLEKRGFKVNRAANVATARMAVACSIPDYALIDLKMPGESGMCLIKELIAVNRNIKIVVLTGYASIQTAVEAIKLGAFHYLAKPADADDVVRAFSIKGADIHINIPENPMSIGRIEWEHIQKVLADHNGNISATARALNMHRRTLQRKLLKRPKRL